DFGLALEAAPERLVHEPRPALAPPNGQKRFTVVIDGVDGEMLRHVWSELCQAGERPPEPEFRAVYPYMTTMQGNRFRCRGGEPSLIQNNLQQLLQKRLRAGPLRTRVEEN